MQPILLLGQLLVSEWIWSITWGFYHSFINVLIMLVLFKLFLGIRIVPAVLLSFFSQLTSFLFFNLFVIVVLIFGFGIEFSLDVGWPYIPDQFYATLYLGLIYALLQTGFFVILNHYYKVHVSWVIALTFMSNCLTTLFLNVLLSIHT